MPSELGTWMVLGTLIVAFLVGLTGLVIQKLQRRRLQPPSPEPLMEEAAGEELPSSPYEPPLLSPSPPPLPEARGFLDSVGTSWVRRFDFLIIGMILGLYLWPLALGLLGQLPEETPKIELATLLSSMVMQVLFCGMIIGVVVWRIKPRPWLGLAWPGKTGIEWAKLIVSIPACIGATWLLLTLLYFTGFIEWVQATEGGDGQQEVVKAFQEIDDTFTLSMLVLMAVVVAPITEEIIFRGYLYPVLKSRTGRLAAIIVSALVFAAVHHNAIALAPLSFLAILLALSFEFTGSIWAPMAIHAAFNGLTVVGQLLMKYGYVQTPTP